MSEFTISITALAYLETQSEEVETLLGTFTVETPLDMIQATFDCKPNVLGHVLLFAPEAVGNRMAGYQIDDVVAAVESLVREILFGWAPDLQPPDPTSPVDVNGGLDPRIAVVWTESASADATAVLDPLADRIFAARDHFTPPPPPDVPPEPDP